MGKAIQKDGAYTSVLSVVDRPGTNLHTPIVHTLAFIRAKRACTLCAIWIDLCDIHSDAHRSKRTVVRREWAVAALRRGGDDT